MLFNEPKITLRQSTIRNILIQNHTGKLFFGLSNRQPNLILTKQLTQDLD